MNTEEIKQKVNKLWGWSSLEDMDAMIKYCQKLPPNPSILEIGTGMGRSALLMALVRPDAEIWTVDGFGQYGTDNAAIALHSKTGFRFNQETKAYAEKIWKDNNADNIHLIVGDSRKIDWDKKVDLLFIDGDHNYKGVKSDFERFSPFVNENGYILFHDVLTKGSGCEVFMFIDEIRENKEWNYINEANVGILTKNPI